MSKKKAPALHERRGREDISTRPPRLAGSPIKLAGKTRLRRLSLAADSCVNRKYYGGDPGVGQRARGFVHKPCIRSGPRGRVEIFARSSPGSHEEHIKCSSARAELAINLTGRVRASVGEQAGETQSVQSNIDQTEFWLMTCSRQKLDRQPSLCPFISCGEIGTEFGVESFKQSLFHRNLWEG